MHKIKLILLLILPLSVLGQDLGIIDTKTTKNPSINGTHRISTDGKNLFFRNFFGLSRKIANTDSAVFTNGIKVNSGVNNVEIDQTQIMFRRTNGTTMTLGNYRAYSHQFFTNASFSGLTQAMSINNYGQVIVGNQILDGISNPTVKFQVGATGEARQRIISQASNATIELNGATSGNISNTTGNLNYTSAGNHVFNSKVILPDSTSIGNISSTELTYLDGVTSPIQTQLNNKATITSPTFITDAKTPRLKITGAGDIGKGSDLVMAGNSNDLTMHGTGKVILGTGGFQRLVVTNAGNVGVGTTAPVAKFEVSGLAGFRYNDGKQADGKYLRSNSTGVAAWDSVKVSEVFGLNTTYLPISNPTATGTLTAPTIANSLGANLATSSGNVGIGTASPAYKLDVSGTARFTGAATFTGGIFSFGSGGITSNTAIGFQALNSNTTGYQNIAIGNSSLSANTTGFNNTANGVNSLSANTTGVSNSAFGLNSLLSNTSGGKNTAIGEQSLSANTTGANNTAVGYFALSNNTTSYGNSAFGYQALIVNTTGQENTSIGFQSLYSNTTGSSNTAIGQQSLYSNTTGGINTSVGLNAGRFISGGSVANTITNNSIYLGGFTKALADNQTNQIVIGHNAVGNGSNTTVLGNTSITQTQIFGNTILSNTSQATDTGEKLQVNGTAKFVNGVNLATTSGNVGIGTTTPSQKLDVDGNIKAFSVSGGGAYYSSTTATDAAARNWVMRGNSVVYGDFDIRQSNALNGDPIAAGNSRFYINPNGNVGIGTTSPNASSILNITSTTKGVLFPRMTTAEISAIASPADGLTVYNTTLKAICFYDSSAAVWKKVSHSNM